jgi:hypothetical protein
VQPNPTLHSRKNHELGQAVHEPPIADFSDTHRRPLIAGYEHSARQVTLIIRRRQYGHVSTCLRSHDSSVSVMSPPLNTYSTELNGLSFDILLLPVVGFQPPAH